jgi:hypothetical protein
MKEYEIQFFYNTDLRWYENVIAKNEVFALSEAMNKLGEEWWVINKNFHIVIKLK